MKRIQRAGCINNVWAQQPCVRFFTGQPGNGKDLNVLKFKCIYVFMLHLKFFVCSTRQKLYFVRSHIVFIRLFSLTCLTTCGVKSFFQYVNESLMSQAWNVNSSLYMCTQFHGHEDLNNGTVCKGHFMKMTKNNNNCEQKFRSTHTWLLALDKTLVLFKY